MSYLIGFAIGIGALLLYQSIMRRIARRGLAAVSDDLRKAFFAEQPYEGLMRIQASLNDELARRREPHDG